MSEVTQNDLPELSEREYLKQEAAILGLSYPNNISLDKLRALVQGTIEERSRSKQKVGSTTVTEFTDEVQAMREAAMAMVRFELTVLDPSKMDTTGTIVSVSNDNLGCIKRAIYFNAPVWHAEKIIVEALKNMKYQYIPAKFNEKMKGTFNNPDEAKLMPCFAIKELPPLTEEELENLKKLQAEQGTGQMQE